MSKTEWGLRWVKINAKLYLVDAGMGFPLDKGVDQSSTYLFIYNANYEDSVRLQELLQENLFKLLPVSHKPIF